MVGPSSPVETSASVMHRRLSWAYSSSVIEPAARRGASFSMAVMVSIGPFSRRKILRNPSAQSVEKICRAIMTVRKTQIPL